MDDRHLETTLDPPKMPEILRGPPRSGRVLVLAPHADDETIGLGGTIILHAEGGDEVDVLFLTQGITGNADGRYDPEEYVRIRRAEGEAACRMLGVKKTSFWEFPDNYQVTENDMTLLVDRLVEIHARERYDVIYTPHRGEIHSDHHVSSVMAARALEKLDDPPELFAYEIWSPLRAEMVVDVSGVFERKLEAAACYKSQIALNDITRLFKSLNGYRSILLENKEGYGEALLRMGRRS